MFRKPILMLIDTNSLAYRAFFAFQRNPLRNSRGENTSACFGFTNSLFKLLSEYSPEYIALVFDSKAPTFRHEKYEEYKAQRPKTPDELSYQMSWIKEIGEGLGIAIYEIPGYEADDIIAVLAKDAERRGMEVLLVTSDKDLLQLVTDNIKVLDTRPKEEILYTKEEVKRKLGVYPEEIPDLLALRGDAIDNIPGVPGIGGKTAVSLIREFGSLDGIYKNIEKISSEHIKKLLLTYREQAQLSKYLASLAEDIPLKISYDGLRIGRQKREKLFNIFRRLEFSSFLAKVAEYPEKADIEEITDIKDINLLSFVDISQFGSFVYLLDCNLKIKKISLERARKLLEDVNVKKSVIDSKSFIKTGLIRNIEVKGIGFDLSIADYLINPEKPRHDVDFLAMEQLGFKLHPEGEEKKAEEIIVLNRLRQNYLGELDRLGLMSLFENIELPLAQVIAKMEKRGVLVNREGLQRVSEEIRRELLEVSSRIFEIAGERFNINSSQQLGRVLFDKLGLPPIKKTKTGYSTDSEVLNKLYEKHKIIPFILRYRELFKLNSTYISSFEELIEEDGRIHPIFHQTQTATGRLSCSSPNLQNVPIKSSIGKKIREVFLAPEDYLLISADYSQIELRILAHLSQDRNLIGAFKNGLDIHKKTASIIFSKREDDVTDSERRKAKVVNFGIAYGMSPYGLSKELNISREEAQRLIEEYFTSYQGVRQWITKTIEEAEEEGIVHTILGRMRKIPELYSANKNVAELGKRIAVNTPIQGSCADIVKKAMVEIETKFERECLDAHTILQIHDELLFEVKERDTKRAIEIIVDRMENTLPLIVPIKVNIGVGKTWLEAHS